MFDNITFENVGSFYFNKQKTVTQLFHFCKRRVVLYLWFIFLIRKSYKSISSKEKFIVFSFTIIGRCQTGKNTFQLSMTEILQCYQCLMSCVPNPERCLSPVRAGPGNLGHRVSISSSSGRIQEGRRGALSTRQKRDHGP